MVGENVSLLASTTQLMGVYFPSYNHVKFWSTILDLFYINILDKVAAHFGKENIFMSLFTRLHV